MEEGRKVFNKLTHLSVDIAELDTISGKQMDLGVLQLKI